VCFQEPGRQDSRGKGLTWVGRRRLFKGLGGRGGGGEGGSGVVVVVEGGDLVAEGSCVRRCEGGDGSNG
jgi:hypothetical protein